MPALDQTRTVGLVTLCVRWRATRQRRSGPGGRRPGAGRLAGRRDHCCARHRRIGGTRPDPTRGRGRCAHLTSPAQPKAGMAQRYVPVSGAARVDRLGVLQLRGGERNTIRATCGTCAAAASQHDAAALVDSGQSPTFRSQQHPRPHSLEEPAPPTRAAPVNRHPIRRMTSEDLSDSIAINVGGHERSDLSSGQVEGDHSVQRALLLFLWVGSGALRRVRGRSSQVKGACGVAARGRFAPPLTCEPLRPLGQDLRAGRGLPDRVRSAPEPQ